jgi:hypothetical protein
MNKIKKSIKLKNSTVNKVKKIKKWTKLEKLKNE